MTESLSQLRDFLRAEAGLAYDANALDAAHGRLAPVIRAANLTGLPALAAQVGAGNKVLRRAVLEAMATHETSFFRDRALFAFVEGVILPKLRETHAQTRRLRIWSAACSTGQEPYSIAMMLDEFARHFSGWCVDIVATDLSAKAVAAARAGRYNHLEVQRGLSTGRLLRYFSRAGDDWQIAEFLRERVEFREFNLLSDCAVLGPFDIVFCRNVFIYFDPATVRGGRKRLAATLSPGGVLVVGAAETLSGLTEDFAADLRQPGVFERVRRQPAVSVPRQA